MTLRVPLAKGVFLTLVSICATALRPTVDDATKDEFYDTLYTTLHSVSPQDNLALLGDFNAQIGTDQCVWDGVIGKHGVGNVNRNGLKKLAEDNLNAPQKQALASPRLHGRQGLKPGFSLDSSVFSALETFVIISLYKSTFAIPYHTICNSLPEHLQLPSMSKGQFQCSLKPTSFSRPIDSENLTFSPDLT